MFRNQNRKSRIFFGLSDLFLTIAAFELAYAIRERLPVSPEFSVTPFFLTPDVRTLLLIFCVTIWVSFGHWLNVHGKLESARGVVILRDSVRQVFYSGLVMVLFVFAMKLQISRFFLASFVLTSWVFLVGFRICARQVVAMFRRDFAMKRNVLIVGLGTRAERLAKSLEEHYEQGLRIVGFLAAPHEQPAPSTIRFERTYGVFPLEGLRSLLGQHVIDEIHFAVESDKLPFLQEVFRWCDEEGICCRIAVDFFPNINREFGLEWLGNTPLLTFSASPGDEVLLLAKRVIDIVLASVAIALLSPLFLVVALLIKLTSPGPVMFRQLRCGLNGRTFTCYKFRSMVMDAEQRLHEVAHLNAKEIATKIPNDPRLTTVGKWLRKSSIDELPQLFNVLQGDMALVGPRPAIPTEVAQYQRWQRRRLRMRPGLTCLWVIHGRDKVDFEKWMRLDLQYIDQWSLGLDAKIILRTIPHVLSGRGAN
jgi:exopolysaccharide biosynthesis polyprenyl glycosylphosphotransferase